MNSDVFLAFVGFLMYNGYVKNKGASYVKA